jgi:hypothetical protein
MSEWISVKERLPDDEEEMVLCYIPTWVQPVTVGLCVSDSNWTLVRNIGTIDDTVWDAKPTHWMPLPPLPPPPPPKLTVKEALKEAIKPLEEIHLFAPTANPAYISNVKALLPRLRAALEGEE